MAKNSKLLSGRHLAQQLISKVQLQWEKYKDEYQPPKLTIIHVGTDHASSIYINHKLQVCKKVGFRTQLVCLDEKASQRDVIDKIHELNCDESVTGILLQLPLPPHLFAPELIDIIDPDKDVDGITSSNLGQLITGNYDLLPCTTSAVLSLLQTANIRLSGAHVVMVGASALVGKPTAIALLHQNATLTVCHSETLNLRAHVEQADILVVAIGNPSVIKPEWIPENCVVIDVGINRCLNNRVVGDIPTEKVLDKVSLITPVPGGVGPLTVANLLKNLFTLYCHKSKLLPIN